MRLFIFAAILIVCFSQANCLEASTRPYSALVLGQQVNVAGPTTWEYTLTNTSPSSNYTVWLFALEIDEETEVTNITTPQGWWGDWSIAHYISWMYVSGELPAGSSQMGFEAQFSNTPAFQNWTVMFNNVETQESPSQEGSVAAAVPEPSSIFALLMGILGTVGWRKKKAA